MRYPANCDAKGVPFRTATQQDTDDFINSQEEGKREIYKEMHGEMHKLLIGLGAMEPRS